MALEKPAHLATTDGPWLATRKCALVALVLGVLSFIVVAIVHPSGSVSTLPAWWLSVPGFALTAVASVASVVRREPQGYWLWAIGLGVAAAAIVLGWFLVIGIVVAVTAIVILILHSVM